MGAVAVNVANHANVKKKKKLGKKASLKKKCSVVNGVETTKDDSTETSAIADKRPTPTTPEEHSSTEINSCKNLKRKKEAKATEDVEVNEEPKLNRKQRKMLKRKMIEEGLLKDPTADPVELAKAFDASAGLKSAENKSSIKRKKKKRDGPAAGGAINSAELTNEDGSAVAPLTKKKRVESAAGGLGHSTASSVHPAHDNAQAVDKFAEILQKLSTVQPASEARKIIDEEIAAGKVEHAEVMTIMQRWRQQKRKMIHAERKEKVVEMEGTLDDVKRVVNELVQKGKLKPWDAGDIIKRWKNRERRRVDRQISKQTNRICFHCRQSGHLLSECPNRDADEKAVGNIAGGHGDGICFKCGSTEHSVHKCPRKHIKGFPFATCFVCGQQGHLSRDCEQNAHGIYPDGGSCNACGSTKHLKRDCPELAAEKQQKDERKVKVRAMSAMTSADYEDVPQEDPQANKMKPKKKIVKF